MKHRGGAKDGVPATGEPVARKRSPNALAVTYVSDNLKRMTVVEENGATSGVGLLATYAYDDLGFRTQTSRAGSVTTASEDGAGRLINMAHTLQGAGVSVSCAFNYTAANQLHANTAATNALYENPGSGITSTACTANGLNQYSAVAGTGFTYDARANLTSTRAATYTYDLENHLLTASGPTPVTLTYDPLGRLQTSTASGATTNFLYDGAMLAGEYDGSGNILRRYVAGASGLDPVVWYEGAGVTNRRWLNTDRLGSVIAWSDQAGNLGANAARGYDAYGNPSNWTGSRFAYTGQTAIPEAQLRFYRARVYAPAIGRFLQTDPIGYASNVNAYAYVNGDPVSGTDPSGMSCADVTVFSGEKGPGPTGIAGVNVCAQGGGADPTGSDIGGGSTGTPGDGGGKGDKPPKTPKDTPQDDKNKQYCDKLNGDVSDTEGNLSSCEAGSWRWNSPDALNFDLERAKAILAEDSPLGYAGGGIGAASAAAAAGKGGLAELAGSRPNTLIGLTVGLFGLANQQDAEMRQNQIDALNARLAQLRAQQAGVCHAH